MAVYTEVSDEELGAFVGSYDLGELWSYKGIAEGVENTNYLIHTESGPYILTLYEKRVRPKELPFFLDLMDHLASSGIKCPTPVRDRDGQMLREIAGRPAAIVTFLEGLWIRRPQVAHCAELGKHLAHFHVAGQSFAQNRKNNLSVGGWRPLFEACGPKTDQIADNLQREIADELDFLEANWPANLAAGIIHADLFPDNVFFLGQEISGLIDFYFACTDMLAFDIAICLNAWCFESDNSFNITKARALLDAYTGVRRLDDDEFELLPILARGAALRFLLTRVYDWLNANDGALVRPKDPIEYLRKLRFHRKVASTREYGLEKA